MRTLDGLRRMVCGKLEKQSALLSRGDQKGSVEGKTFVPALKEIMIRTSVVGGRKALLCLRGREEQCAFSLAKHVGRCGK